LWLSYIILGVSMSEVKSLGTPISEIKSLTKDDVALLAENGIETVEALIYRRRELEEIFEVPDETAKHNKIRNAVIEALSLKKMWMVSAKEWAKVEAGQIVFDTGSNALNTILGGGIHSMSVAEFYGEFGVGKSQILNTTMVLALNKFPDRTAIYIDTEKTFHYGRIKQIAEARGFNADDIMNRIILLKPPTTDDLIELIKRLYLTVEKRKAIIIVCDSLISHLRAEYLGREMLQPRAHALSRILSRLKLLAELYNIGTVTSNQVVAVPQATMTPFGEIKAAGGHIMAHAVEPRVFVRKAGVSTRIARIEDSAWLPPAEATFRISEKGIEDVSKEEK
jgi:DNA repair protein RadA